MKKNKGFTLVELLGIMAVLGLILLITIPALTNTLKNSTVKEFERFKSDLIIATESYIESNRDQYPELEYIGGKTLVEISELKSAGYINRKVIDPETEKEVPDSNTILVTVGQDKIFKYEYTGKSNGFNSYEKAGLMLWYDGKLHGTHDNIWTDLSGNNNNGYLENFAYDTVSGWTNNGLKFDGVDDFISVRPFSNLPSGNNPYTIEVVLYYNKPIASGISAVNCPGLISLGTTSGKANGLSLCDGGINHYYLGNNLIAPDSITLNHGYTITAKNEGASRQLLVNGVQKNKDTATASTDLNEVILGHMADQYFADTIFSVRVYNRALTDEEVVKNYEIDKIRFGL